MGLSTGGKAIDFSLKGTDDKVYSLEDFPNKKILGIIFSCNHCPYVVAYEDRMITLQKKYAERGVQFAAVNANDAVKYPEDSFENMKKRASEKGFNFPYLYDETQQIARAYGAAKTPEVFLFDENRLLAYHGRIDDSWDDANNVKESTLSDAIEALLSGRDVPKKDTQPVGCTIKWK